MKDTVKICFNTKKTLSRKYACEKLIALDKLKKKINHEEIRTKIKMKINL